MTLYLLRQKIQELRIKSKKFHDSQSPYELGYRLALDDIEVELQEKIDKIEFRLSQLKKIHFENLSFGHINIDCWCYKIMDELVLILGKKDS